MTEAGSGLPVAGARVTAGARGRLTDAAGHYQFIALPVGTYDMTATKFGLSPGSASGVEVDESEHHDAGLRARGRADELFSTAS